MRIRSLGLVAFAGLSIALSACSSGSGASGSAAAAAPSATPDPCAGAAKHSGDARTLPTDKSQTKIGVAADVGKIDDKNFNEYTYKGASRCRDRARRHRCRAVRDPGGRDGPHPEHPEVRR